MFNQRFLQVLICLSVGCQSLHAQRISQSSTLIGKLNAVYFSANEDYGQGQASFKVRYLGAERQGPLAFLFSIAPEQISATGSYTFQLDPAECTDTVTGLSFRKVGSDETFEVSTDLQSCSLFVSAFYQGDEFTAFHCLSGTYELEAAVSTGVNTSVFKRMRFEFVCESN